MVIEYYTNDFRIHFKLFNIDKFMVQNGNGNYINVPAVKGFPNLLQYPIKIMLQVEVALISTIAMITHVIYQR